MNPTNPSQCADTRYLDIASPYIPVKWDRVDFERLYRVRLAVRAGYYNEGESC